MGFYSKHELSDEQTSRFQPYQIVCLEYAASRLYAEVVQSIDWRQMCWVRPLVLVEAPLNDTELNDNDLLDRSCLYDLRQGSDLLWPLTLFRAALDSEVLPLLSYLYDPDHEVGTGEIDQKSHLQFKQFVHQVWQAYREMF